MERVHVRLTVSSSLRAFVVIAVLVAAAAASAAPAHATTVVRGKTFTDFQIHAGAHDIVYEDCTFAGGRPQVSVIRLDRACRNITFRDCVIQSGPWNGVSVNDRRGNIRNITFYRCRFRPQARMGFECTTRPADSGKGYRGIKLIRCVFDPQGSEAISFDGNSACTGNGVFRSVIWGAGTNLEFPWGQGVEVNRVGQFRFMNNKVYQCRGSLLNLQRASRADCNWTFRGNRLDATVHRQTVPMDALAQVVCAAGVWGGDFHDNTIVSSHPGAGVAWFGDCHRMDWRWNRWQDSRRGMFDEPMQQWGCSGNLF